VTATPDLDRWVPEPVIRVSHRRTAHAGAADLWDAARSVRLDDTRMLGRLVRMRIPGIEGNPSYDELFRAPPFTPLDGGDHGLVSGLCGRIWTLRRDYPDLAGPDDFKAWAEPGTVRVMFANWVAPEAGDRAAITSEVRVEAVDRGGRFGLLAVRPLIRAFNGLIATESLALAVRRAQGTDPAHPETSVAAGDRLVP
jgi:hypothetical protein